MFGRVTLFVATALVLGLCVLATRPSHATPPVALDHLWSVALAPWLDAHHGS